MIRVSQTEIDEFKKGLTAEQKHEIIAASGWAGSQFTTEGKLDLACEQILKDRKSAAADFRNEKLTEIDQRLRRLEKLLGPRGKALIDPVIEALAEALPEAIDRRMDKRGAMVYCGVYDDGREYMRGDVVTHSGACWIATATVKDQRPGKGMDWRMITKGTER